MGAVALTALNTALAEQARSAGATAWIPPDPSQEQQEESTLLLAAYPQAEALADYETGPVPPPPVPAIIPEVYVDSTNAFPTPPLDANGCPYIAPLQMAALSALPYSGFAAISEPTTEFPPLPEGLDVMPLATANGIFVETEDFFRFRAISTNNNVPVSFFGRVQRPSGYLIPFNHTINTSTANTTFTINPVPGKGILLGCAASVPIGSITSGAVNAVGEIGRMQGGTFTPHTLLFSGQLDDLYPLTIDGGGIPPSSDRPTILSVTGAGPTANFITLSVTPNTGKRVRFVFGRCTSVSSAAAGDRTGFFVIQRSGTTLFDALGNMPQGPSSTVQWNFTIGANGGMVCPALLSAGIPVSGQLPETLYFYEAVNVLIGAGSAAETITNAVVFYEES